MKKVESGTIKLKDIKHLENSRLRENDDVSSLMKDIEQRGLLEPIGIRISDNALIFGNRRVTSFEKLGYTEIDCVFYDDVTDEELYLANIAENVKRKNIGNFEIGRMCTLLTEKGMKTTEIAETLNFSIRKIKSLILAFKVTKDTPFYELITSGKRGKHLEGVPESLIWFIHNNIPKGLGRSLTTLEWNTLLIELDEGRLTTIHIRKLRQILSANKKMSLKDALKLLEKCKVLHIFFTVDNNRLSELMEEEKASNEIEFIRNIIKKYDKELLF